MTNSLIPYSFVPGTKALASEVNANFIALADEINESKNYTDNSIEKMSSEMQDLSEELKNSVNNSLSNKLDSDFSNSTNTTDCFTEIPQRIKYTLSSGALTIKAGSVVIFPYGTNDQSNTFSKDSQFLNSRFKVQDTRYLNGKFFVWAELLQDINISYSTVTNELSLLLSASATILTPKQYCTSTATAPATNGAYRFWFDTNTNYVKMYAPNSSSFEYASLPLMNINCYEANKFTLNTVFNGMGYIGSTVWLDKDVKGLIANGKYSNGTLKNTPFKTQSLFYNKFTYTGKVYFEYYVSNNTIADSIMDYWHYSDTTNTHVHDNTLRTTAINFASGYEVGGVISNFTPKTVFRTLNSNELNNIKTYVISTYVNGTSGYRIWSDGYCEQWGYFNKGTSSSGASTISFMKTFANTNYNILLTDSYSAATNAYSLAVTAKTTSGMSVGKTTSTWIYAYWKVSGYLHAGQY